MKLSRDKQGTKERARAMHDFMVGAAARGIKVTVRLKQLYDPTRQTNESHLFLAATTVADVRDPVNLEERVDGDIRDTITSLALQIGLRPKLST